MYLARLETSNFEFLAVAQSREDALGYLEKAWNRHIENCEGCYSWEFVKDSAWVIFTRSGDIWRDGDLIHSHDSADPWIPEQLIN